MSKRCSRGYRRNKTTGECDKVDKSSPQQTLAPKTVRCRTGYKKNKDGVCYLETPKKTSPNIPDLTDANIRQTIARYLNGNPDGFLPIGEWDTSKITDMSRLFYRSNINESIGKWDVKNVTNMSNMFSECSSFNQDIGKWDVGNVTNMSFMFSECRNFNQSIDKWNVGNVTDMSFMFNDCRSFNAAIGKWNVRNATNMMLMFKDCSSFNQNISKWVVENVILTGMFYRCTSFNQNIGKWGVGKVTTMSSMFKGCTSFNKDIGKWDVRNVQYMDSMFEDCTSFNKNIGKWDVRNVQYMDSMFKGCTSFKQDLSGWYIRDHIRMNMSSLSKMFLHCPMKPEFFPRLVMAHDFDIIIGVHLHGATTTSCPRHHEKNFANATLMEGSPCGSRYCTDSKREHNPRFIREFLYKNKDAQIIVHQLQQELREDKKFGIEKTEKKNPTAYADPKSLDFKNQPGWSIITNGYMERRYSDDPVKPNLINVYYVAPGASNVYKTNENIYSTFSFQYPNKTRTNLMQLLKDMGYKKPLILDFTCGGFDRKFGFDSPTRKEKRALAVSLGVAGGKKVRTRRK
jgi:surface protein